MVIYKTLKGSYHLNLKDAIKEDNNIYQLCPIMNKEEYNNVVEEITKNYKKFESNNTDNKLITTIANLNFNKED